MTGDVRAAAVTDPDCEAAGGASADQRFSSTLDAVSSRDVGCARGCSAFSAWSTPGCTCACRKCGFVCCGNKRATVNRLFAFTKSSKFAHRNLGRRLRCEGGVEAQSRRRPLDSLIASRRSAGSPRSSTPSWMLFYCRALRRRSGAGVMSSGPPSSSSYGATVVAVCSRRVPRHRL